MTMAGEIFNSKIEMKYYKANSMKQILIMIIFFWNCPSRFYKNQN